MPSSPIEALRRIAPEAVRDGEHAARYAVCGVAPSAVVAPSSSEEAAAVLALCSEHGWRVEPAGAGTWLDAGSAPERVDVVLTTERLAGVTEYEPADLTIGAGAGVPLERLQAGLARHRQMLPLDPPAAAGATLGATFSTASAGPLRLGLGTPRDHALGVELVTGDGRVLKFGGRVVKNVAGYDLVRLAVGSRGALGLITRLHVRLRPVPDRDTTAAAFAAEPAPLVALAPMVVRQAYPVALELLSPLPAARLLGDVCWALVARFQGNEDAVRDAADRLRTLVNGASLSGAAEPFRVLINSEGATLWAGLRDMEARARLLVRLGDVPARLDATLEAALRIVRSASPSAGDAEWSIAAHAGDGIVRAWMDGEGAPDRVAEAIMEARRAYEARGAGSLLVPRAPPALGERLAPRDVQPALRRLIDGMRREFDPAGILSARRTVL